MLYNRFTQRIMKNTKSVVCVTLYSIIILLIRIQHDKVTTYASPYKAFCDMEVNFYQFKLSLFSKKSKRPMVTIPSSLRLSFMSSFTMIIFLKESL